MPSSPDLHNNLDFLARHSRLLLYLYERGVSPALMTEKFPEHTQTDAGELLRFRHTYNKGLLTQNEIFLPTNRTLPYQVAVRRGRYTESIGNS